MRRDRRKAASRPLEIHSALKKVYGAQSCNLSHSNPLQLLVATILSAQCTDKMVNRVAEGLFKRFPDARSFAFAKRAELEREIKPCGCYRTKAGHIIEACGRIVDEFGGKVPSTMEKLTSLPGVGRKTASVVLGDAFGLPGFAVDTHVKRLSKLIGLTASCDPAKIEADVCASLPPDLWNEFSHLLIVHGRRRCPARRPDCLHCEIRSLCDFGRRKAKDA